MSQSITSKRLGSISDIRSLVYKESWLDHFNVEDTIGRGKFAVVKMCMEKSTLRRFAAKCIRKRRHCRDCTQDIMHEIAVLELSENHPHLINLHRVYESTSEFVLILEFAAGGEIFDHCVGVKDKFSEETTRRLFHQILQAVSFLHSNNIAHLDLKPQNILLTEEGSNGNIKLVDFGLSKHIADNIEIREILGTPDYVAPEILNFEPISTLTDIWSLGVVCYVMLTGVSPFLGETKNETLMNVTTGSVDFPDELFGDKHASCKDLIWKMLQREPNERITAEEVLHHPWLVGTADPKSNFILPVSPRLNLENGDAVFHLDTTSDVDSTVNYNSFVSETKISTSELSITIVANGEDVDINENLGTSTNCNVKNTTPSETSYIVFKSNVTESITSDPLSAGHPLENKENNCLSSNNIETDKEQVSVSSQDGSCNVHSTAYNECGCMKGMHEPPTEISSLRKRRKFDSNTQIVPSYIDYNLACVDFAESVNSDSQSLP